ncbi:Uncharacterized protein ChrSV_4886 [Chromobacterium vaccinii]|nr:Uncharacterized protein ChrSW_4880 [Chromobacterium vaccinii]QND92341.1 Uncharacterized protein ChrSV_4886 [Chromobacterium vaccinii]
MDEKHFYKSLHAKWLSNTLQLAFFIKTKEHFVNRMKIKIISCKVALSWQNGHSVMTVQPAAKTLPPAPCTLIQKGGYKCD